jgi:hypothetical protein
MADLKKNISDVSWNLVNQLVQGLNNVSSVFNFKSDGAVQAAIRLLPDLNEYSLLTKINWYEKNFKMVLVPHHSSSISEVLLSSVTLSQSVVSRSSPPPLKSPVRQVRSRLTPASPTTAKQSRDHDRLHFMIDTGYASMTDSMYEAYIKAMKAFVPQKYSNYIDLGRNTNRLHDILCFIHNDLYRDCRKRVDRCASQKDQPTRIIRQRTPRWKRFLKTVFARRQKYWPTTPRR